MKITTTVNGKKGTYEIDDTMRAIDFLRDTLGLTGTKEGCGKGECGACTILLNGRPVNSCLLYAAKLEGNDVMTIEGLSPEDGTLHPIQNAFLDAGAVQCGFCTPGMILSAKALLDTNPAPGVGEIEEALSGNICRCTGYSKIVEAVQLAASRGDAGEGEKR